MSEGIRFKRLSPGDAAIARRLNGLFARAFSDPVTYGEDRPDDAYLAELLGKDHVVILVALRDEAVVGGLVAYEMDKLEARRREVYLYDLAVDEACRRQGIATRLIEQLREHAATRGAWVVMVQGDPGDEPALALYDKLGVREEVLHFDISVGEPKVPMSGAPASVPARAQSTGGA